MPRILYGLFVLHSQQTQERPPTETRALLSRLVDDLQVIAQAQPIALEVLAAVARKIAAPIRRRLEQQRQREAHAADAPTINRPTNS